MPARALAFLNFRSTVRTARTAKASFALCIFTSLHDFSANYSRCKNPLQERDGKEKTKNQKEDIEEGSDPDCLSGN